jgi:hypothetical protein
MEPTNEKEQPQALKLNQPNKTETTKRNHLPQIKTKLPPPLLTPPTTKTHYLKPVLQNT